MSTRRVAALVVLLLGVLALAVVRVPPPSSEAAPIIRVRWAPGVDAAAQVEREAAFRLWRYRPPDDRTWTYQLLDASPSNIRAIIMHAAVEDTDGIDRREFRIAVPSISVAEWITRRFPVLERVAGPGFREWLRPENGWPAVLGAAWLIALLHPRSRGALLRGVPELSPLGLGLFRIALGLALLATVAAATEVAAAPLPRELHRGAGWFADRQWVHALALAPDINSLVLLVGLAALALFTAGVFPRAALVVALVAITARVFVVLQHRSAHDLGLPLVALWGLAAVPWHSAGLGAWRARPAGDDAPGHLMRGFAPRFASGFALWWPGAVLGLGLLAAAYAKLDTSGWNWITGGAVRYHFIEDFRQAPTGWGLWIAARPPWAVAVSSAAIGAEALLILHVFFRQPVIRGIFGALALLLLAGLYLLQGIVWPLWWVLLLVFVPWDVLAGAMNRAARSAPASPARPLRGPQLALIGLVVCLQIFASARRVEIEPFVSDYGMYSWSWPSAEAFDAQLARKYRAYRYATGDAAGEDVTARIRSLPGAATALTDAIDRFREGRAPTDEERAALRAIHASYEAAYDVPIGRVRVFLDEEAFDWARGRFYRKEAGRQVAVIELSEGAIRPPG